MFSSILFSAVIGLPNGLMAKPVPAVPAAPAVTINPLCACAVFAAEDLNQLFTCGTGSGGPNCQNRVFRISRRGANARECQGGARLQVAGHNFEERCFPFVTTGSSTLTYKPAKDVLGTDKPWWSNWLE